MKELTPKEALLKNIEENIADMKDAPPALMNLNLTNYDYLQLVMLIRDVLLLS